jgi:hypothetical protein
VTDPRELPLLDVRLLRGFRFTCRPDCGLCCFAEPRVEPSERPRLLQIAPDAQIRERRGGSFLAAWPQGGACRFLTDHRCAVWPARPGPCREFPVTAHVADRLQATLVLSCPGIDLAPLALEASWESRPEPAGLDEEIASVRARLSPSLRDRMEAARRRRRRVVAALERSGQWVDEEEVRSALRRGIPLPTAAEFPVEDPPTAEEGLEALPLVFLDRSGPVAFAGALGGWDLLELRAGGGADAIARVPPPSRPPRVDPDGMRLLAGYLRYFLERDALFGSVGPEIEPGSGETIQEAVADALRRIGAWALSRADVLRRATGGGSGESLTTGDIVRGIRACDQELLDRPTWGDRV